MLLATPRGSRRSGGCRSVTSRGRCCGGRPCGSDRHPSALHRIPLLAFQGEGTLKGHELPPVLFREFRLPRFHLRVGNTFGNPPEPDGIGIELHPFGVPEVARARLDRLAILAVTACAVHVRIFLTDEDLPSLFDDLVVCPPSSRHVLVGVLGRSRRRRDNRPFASFTTPDHGGGHPDYSNKERHTCDISSLHRQSPAPFYVVSRTDPFIKRMKKDAFTQAFQPQAKAPSPTSASRSRKSTFPRLAFASDPARYESAPRTAYSDVFRFL